VDKTTPSQCSTITVTAKACQRKEVMRGRSLLLKIGATISVGNPKSYRLPSPSYWQGSQTLGSRNSSVKPLDVAI
jgi:hypothetical protein